MTNYVFIYHGGGMPDTPEEGAAMMEKWQAWYGTMGSSVVDGGAPVGMSRTVSSAGVVNDGGPNPVSGYTVVSADDFDAACEMAKGCPILEQDGSVEVAEKVDM